MTEGEFRRERAHWYRLLRESGFEDIETMTGALVDRDAHPWRAARIFSAPEGADAGTHHAVVRWRDRAAIARYYELALRFVHTRRYAEMPRPRRRAWSLHALGYSNAEVAREVGMTLKAVRVSIAACRLAAGLPEVTSSLGHGRRAA